MAHKHGDIINGYEYLPKDKRKKIVLMSDDLRMSSGVGTISRELVLGTAHHYNWVQMGGAVKHPEQGKRVDVSDAVNKEIGLSDTSVIIYPLDGYGNIDILRQIINIEKPNALMPYTDPRFWVWLWQHEHELRQKLPILFYHVWDDLPFPKYNEAYYESCDWIGCISKQTYNIVRNVWKTNAPKKWQIDYIPHGINPNTFYPVSFENPGKMQTIPSGKIIEVKNEKGELVKQNEMIEKSDYEIMIDFKNKLFGNDEPEFVLLYVNRNVRRKMTQDVILAYDKFCNSLSEEDAKNCVLLMHTAPVDEAGTDLPVMIKQLEIKHRIVFSDARIEPRFMNIVFNIADATINLASNEGFGLGTAESLMVGTPIIVNVTGGLQDQCGFKKTYGENALGEVVKYDESKYITVDDYDSEWGSNHDGKYTEHGEWVTPIFPSTISLMGSIPTPYIYDDRCRWQDVALKIKHWYDMGREKRKELGLKGREYMIMPETGMSSVEMCKRFMNGINATFEKWTSRKKFSVCKVSDDNIQVNI